MDDQRAEDLQAEVDELRSMVFELQNRVSFVESDTRRAAELAQSAEYTASDAKRAADEAANMSRRGW